MSESDATLRVHLLDMGGRSYGDAILVQHASRNILVDGGHAGDYRSSGGFPSIPEQLAELLGGGPPFHVDLLVVTHCHSDHVGCLPKLVEGGELRAEWALVADERLAFGHAIDEEPPDLGDPRTLLAAALREDSRADLGEDELAEFLEDARSLEARYGAMLEQLEQAGTRVVRHPLDDPQELLAAFADQGLKILGPSEHHFLLCTDAIRSSAQDLTLRFSQLPEQDFADRMTDLYRRLAVPPAEDSEDRPGPGAALNDQSLVLHFEVGGRRVLLPGDMQLARAEVEGLDPHMAELRETIARHGPYDLIKAAHHSSYNGLDPSVLDQIPAEVLAHSGGSGPHHPSRRVLEMLSRRPAGLRWCRTDVNGRVTVTLGPEGISVRPQRGSLNDFRPPPGHLRSPDRAAETVAEAPLPATERAPGTPAGPPPVAHSVTVGEDHVEIVARIPRKATRVTLTVEVEPLDSGLPVRLSEAAASRPSVADPSEAADIRLADGRDLPPLLFVTHRSALERNIGTEEARRAIAAIRRAPRLTLVDVDGAASVSEAAVRVQGILRQRPEIEGVVILGGYDVVPSQRLDVLDPGLRAAVRKSRHTDSDDFLVWSDEVYGEVDGDGAPDLPVSRIPDGQSAELVFRALQSRPPRTWGGRFGVRNVYRPFADDVFRTLDGSESLYVSEPTVWDRLPPPAASTSRVYLMLHGHFQDPAVFTGESSGGNDPYPEAFRIDNVARCFDGVVFTGCCWGALPVVLPAAHSQPGRTPLPRRPTDSIALAYLLAGAWAFVGCTGTHYSPRETPYKYFGQPMHVAFWSALARGLPPARALFEAKIAYLGGMPYRSRQAVHLAIESKILRQFTCLGLGW